jgi:UDP-N-acetyl-D-mannosaminuronic acid dehydrogenase
VGVEQEHHGEICVIGLGAVGLPIALWCIARGRRVRGVDRDAALIERLGRGECSAQEPGLSEALGAALEAKSLRLGRDLPSCSAYLICVPTSAPDASSDGAGAVREVAARIARVVPRGALVLVISTVSPGVTRRDVAGVMRAVGRTPGEDIFIAFSPERISPGSALAELDAQERVVGGVTPRCTERAASLWRGLGARVVETEAAHAEAAKLFENTYRYVNIALANELADVASGAGLDAAQVFALANTHARVGLHRFGVGAGGRCLPMSARAVAAMGDAPLVQLADAALRALPARLAGEIVDWLGAGARVALLGASYKADACGLDESPAAALWAALEAAGLEVRLVEPGSPRGVPLKVALDGADGVVLAVGHQAFATLDPEALAGQMRGRMALDLCRCWDGARWRAAGFMYRGRGLGARDEQGDSEES